MKQVELEARERQGKGKSATHKIRREGRVPGILYSKKGNTVMVDVEERALRHVLSHGDNVLVNLKIAGHGKNDSLAMVSEVQRDIFQTKLVHVDFHAVSATEKITSTVSIAFHGHSPAEKDGGIVAHVRREVEIEAFPQDIPQSLVLDISDMLMDQSKHVSDLKVPKGVTILTEADEVLAVVHTSRAAIEAAATPAEGASAEPALVEKKEKSEG
jgi:large subunit ribosomal protein L25